MIDQHHLQVANRGVVRPSPNARTGTSESDPRSPNHLRSPTIGSDVRGISSSSNMRRFSTSGAVRGIGSATSAHTNFRGIRTSSAVRGASTAAIDPRSPSNGTEFDVRSPSQLRSPTACSVPYAATNLELFSGARAARSNHALQTAGSRTRQMQQRRSSEGGRLLTLRLFPSVSQCCTLPDCNPHQVH